MSKPLAASLALTTAGASLLAGVVGGFSYPNFFHAAGLAPSGGPILSSVAKKELGKKDATKGGGHSPHLWNPPPAYDVGAAAAHCTGYQADLFLHPSSGLVSRPLAAALALTTAGASLLAGVVGSFSHPNIFHAIGLAPSGGSILSSPAKKE